MALSTSSNKQIQARLVILAAVFMFLAALELTLSPAARLRTWDVSYRWSHWLGVVVWGLGLYVAHRESDRFIPARDPYLLPVAALLSGWGMLTIWRLSSSYGLRQTVALALVAGIFTLGLRLPSNLGFLRRFKYVFLTSGLLLASLTLVLGTNPLGYGPRLWLGCCGVYFQPSEILKLLLIVYLAAYLADTPLGHQGVPSNHTGTPPVQLKLKGKDIPTIPTGAFISQAGSREVPGAAPDARRFPSQRLHNKVALFNIAPGWLALLVPTIVLTGLALLLLVAQRDLGTASIFTFLYAVMVYIASGRKRFLLLMGLALALASLLGYSLFDVVRLRVDAWLNPWNDPSGRSYQIVQSLIAIANGGTSGRGIGLGSPSLVPIAHSDFIFSAMAEEGGLPLVIGLLCLVALLAVRGLRTALYAPNTFQRYLAAGLTAYLVGQSILIIGGNLRLLPLTGVTLPFVSSGGSSLLISFLSLLCLLHISHRGQEQSAVVSLPRTHLYLQLGGFLLVGITAAGVLSGWWMVYRGPDLITRTDNPRRAISDRTVKRGALLDRSDTPINQTVGSPGTYERNYLYASLSPVVGYRDPVYGQSGLEASLDSTLSGLRGNPSLSVWWQHILYGQPPPGLDVRLSIDLDLQAVADEQLGECQGAIVLLDAQSGEVLAMASHPTFDANQLEEDWARLVSSPDSPLLDRASLGQYPTTGSGLSFVREGFASPLEMAAAAAVLSAGGKMPTPQLALAVYTPRAGWVLLPGVEAEQVLSEPAANAVAESNRSDDVAFWHKVFQAKDWETSQPGQAVTWYLGGTLTSWQGSAVAVAVLLEEDNLILAQKIGQAVLQSAVKP